MANLTFPSNPTNGQKYTFNGKVFEYSSSTGRWSATRAQLLGSLPDDVTIPTPVVTLSQNDVEFDALSNNFVNVSVDQDVKITVTNQTTNATSVFYPSNSTIKVDTSEFDLINGIIEIRADNGRTIGTANLVFSSNNDFPLVSIQNTVFYTSVGDDAFEVTVTAVDPENQGLTYSSSIGGYANAVQSVTNSANVYTVTVTSDNNNVGNAEVTFTVSDGVKSASKTATVVVTIPFWDLNFANLSYDNKSLTVKPSSYTIRGIDISTDGNYFFSMGSGSGIYQAYRYDLSTPFDISTGTYAQGKTIDIWSGGAGTQDGYGISFSDDGLHMIIVERNSDQFRYFQLSTAWDLTTLTYIDAVATSLSDPFGCTYADNGNYAFSAGSSSGRGKIRRWVLSTPYDMRTASASGIYDTQTDLNNSFVGNMVFNSDGTKLWLDRLDSSQIWQFDMTEGYNLSTISYTTVGFATAGKGIAISRDGKKFYSSDGTNAYQYSTGN